LGDFYWLVHAIPFGLVICWPDGSGLVIHKSDIYKLVNFSFRTAFIQMLNAGKLISDLLFQFRAQGIDSLATTPIKVLAVIISVTLYH